MSRRRCAFALFAALAAGAVAGDGMPGLAFQHGDWELACDNTGTCRAAGFQAEGDPPVSVLLTRAAGPDTPVEAALGLGDTDQLDAQAKGGTILPPTFALSMRIDGRAHGTVPSQGGRLTARQVTALLHALRRRSRIAFQYEQLTLRLSGTGAAAVLRKLDDYQRRTGTRGALMRPGSATERRVLPATPIPAMREAALAPARPGDAHLPGTRSQSLIAALRRTDTKKDCLDLHGPDNGSAASGPTVSVQRLSATHLLVSTACVGLAHRPLTGYWVVDAAAAHPPALVTIEGDAAESSGGAIRVVTAGGRPGSDCHGVQDWHWNGKQFLMTSWAQSGGCGKRLSGGGFWSMPRMVSTLLPGVD